MHVHTRADSVVCEDYSPPGSSAEFFMQEYWSELPFPTPGIEPASLCLLHEQADSLPLCHLAPLHAHTLRL